MQVLRRFQESVKNVLKVFQGYFKEVSCCLPPIEATRAQGGLVFNFSTYSAIACLADNLHFLFDC